MQQRHLPQRTTKRRHVKTATGTTSKQRSAAKSGQPPDLKSYVSRRDKRLLVRRCSQQAKLETDDVRRAMLEAIADDVARCRRKARCKNDACPRYNKIRQAWFVEAAKKVVEHESRGADLAVVSIIPKLRLTIGASIPHIKEQVTRVLTELKRGLEAAGVTFLVGGIDISVNETRRGRTSKDKDPVGSSRLQLHLWGIGLAAELEAAKPALKLAFPKIRNTLRPVRVQAFDNGEAGYAYGLKPNFSRRISLPPMVTKAGEVNSNRSSKNTRLKKLTVQQHAEVAILLNIIGFQRRVFLIGADLVNGENGRTSIQPRNRG